MAKKEIFLIITTVMILLFSNITLAVSYTNTQEKNDIKQTEEYDHTVFIEEGTAMTCVYCPAVAEILHDLYESGQYPFEYVSLVSDGNEKAQNRVKEDYNLYGFPTTFIDGGYEVVYGSNPKSFFEEKIQNSLNRETPDIQLSMNLSWNDSKKQLTTEVTIHNNETDIYEGNLKIYVSEIVSRYYNDAGNPYDYGFLDFAEDKTVSISAEDSLTVESTWKAVEAGFSDVDPVNLMVHGVIFNSTSEQRYSDPPTNNNSFDAYFSDESIGKRVAYGNLPPAVGIVHPKLNYLHIFGKPIRYLSLLYGNTILIGRTNIKVNASDDGSIEKVEFYIDDQLVNTDDEEPYEWIWKNNAFGKKVIKTIAYDDEGKNTTTTRDIYAFIIGSIL